MAKREIIKDSTTEDERLLSSVINNKPDIVLIRGKKFKVYWTHPSVDDWISDLLVEKGNNGKVMSQAAALIMLNGFWKCHLFYWIVWRWYYYVRQYNALELMPLFEMAQKKTAAVEGPAYLTAMIYLTGLNNLKKQKTKEEAERILREQATGKDGSSPKNTE